MSGIVSPGYLSPLTGFTVRGLPRVYYQTLNSELMELAWTGSLWAPSPLISPTGAVPPLKTGSLSGFEYVNGSPQVYYQSRENHIMELKWADSSWMRNDLTAWAHADNATTGPAGSGSPLVAYNVPSASPHVYYLSVEADHTWFQNLESHVMELMWDGSNWSVSDLTNRSTTRQQLTAPVDTFFLAGFNAPPVSPHVYYQSRENHIMELMWTGSIWAPGDLTFRWGGGPAASNSPLLGIMDSFPHVYYLSPANNVMELWWNGSMWVATDLTALTGAAPAASNSHLAGFSDHIGPHVYYQTPDNHVMELEWTGSWTWRNFTTQGGAPLAAPGSPLVAFATPDEFPHVYYLSQDFHVVEVKWVGVGGLSGSEITT